MGTPTNAANATNPTIKLLDKYRGEEKHIYVHHFSKEDAFNYSGVYKMNPSSPNRPWTTESKKGLKGYTSIDEIRCSYDPNSNGQNTYFIHRTLVDKHGDEENFLPVDMSKFFVVDECTIQDTKPKKSSRFPWSK